MRRIVSGTLAAALLAFGATHSHAASADKANTTVGEVVVEGQRAPKLGSFSPLVTKFVGAHAKTSPIGTLARWQVPVCPGTIGLAPAYGAFVSKRIVEDAARMGAPRKPACGRHANVMVIFTTVPQQLMDDVREHHDWLLGYHFVNQEKALATFHGPVEAWHVSGSLWAASGTTSLDDPYANGKNSATHGAAPWMRVGDESRLKYDRSDGFVFTLVVVDANQIEDQPIGTVADQIALWILSDPRSPRSGCSTLPSLLDKLDPACAESASLETFSPYDEGFLKGLYRSNGEEHVALERGEIDRYVAKASSTSDTRDR